MARVCENLERVKLFVDDIIVFSSDGAEHVKDLEQFFERMVKFDLKLAPKKTNLGVKQVVFLGHKVTAEGVWPDPEKVTPMLNLPMPTNVSGVRSLLGSLSYYRKFLKNMSAKVKPLTALLKKGAKFVFTAEHAAIVKELMERLSSPEVLAFPCYEGAISGERPFRLVTDASVLGLGAVVEQKQKDNKIRPLCYLSRSTFPNEANWPANELECGAIVWAIKKNRTLFYGIPFEIYSDHSSLKNLASISEKNNRVQRWFDFLSAYTYVVKHRPGAENGNADLLSRLPQPATEEDLSPDLRLTDPGDVDVYAVGVRKNDTRKMVSVLGGRMGSQVQNPCVNFEVGEKEKEKMMEVDVISGNGGVEETKESWNGNEGGSGSGAGPQNDAAAEGVGAGSGGPAQAIPLLDEEFADDDLSLDEAVEFGKKLGEKKVQDWVNLQRSDKTASLAVVLITEGVAVKEIIEEEMPEGVVADEVRRLVAQGTVMLLEDDSKLLVRKETKEPKKKPSRKPGQFERLLGEEPVRTYVPMRVRPWVMDCCHKEVVHLGQKVTLQVLSRLYWWVGMAESVQWWCRRCYLCQFRKVPRHLNNWPLVSLPLPIKPGQVVAFDYLGPLPKTDIGNEFVFLIVDLFSRHAEGYALSKELKDSKGFVSILVNEYIPRWGCPHTWLSDRGPEFATGVAKGVYKMLGTVKKFTSSYHPQTNGMVERLNHTVCQMLAHLIVDNQKDWDVMLGHVVAAHNNNVSRGTGLAPNQIHIGRYARVPMTILEGRDVPTGLGMKQEQLEYVRRMREKQLKAYELVRKEDQLTKDKYKESNEQVEEYVGKREKIDKDDWVLVYDDKSTIAGGGEHVLKENYGRKRSFALSGKLSHNWTGPYKVLLVGPGKTSEGQEVGSKLLYLEINADELGKGITPRVSVHRCKKCYFPDDVREMPRFLPWNLSKYVLNKYSELVPPYHLTREDVGEELDERRILPFKISRHRICRGLGGKVTVQYYTHWIDKEERTWEHEVELEQYGDVVLKYWHGQTELVSGGNTLYRRYRVYQARRLAAYKKGERYVAKGYKLCCDTRGRPNIRTTDMIGSFIYYLTIRTGWQFAKVTQVVTEEGTNRVLHTIKLLDIGRSINVELEERNLTTDEEVQEPGTWCWHAHVTAKDVKKCIFDLAYA